jgi:hypothetical protein
MQTECRAVENEMDKLQGDYSKNEDIFKNSRDYQADIQKKIRETNAENEQLRQANFRLHLRTQEVTDLESELRMITEERDQIER